VLSYADLALSIAATAGDDHLLGRTAGSTKGVELDGGAGNDWLEGGAGGDILFAGKGDDILQGASGADTYVFARGDGQDVILDLGGNSAAERDRVRFGAGINPADIKVEAIGPTDLVFGLAGSDDRLTLKNMVVSAWSPQDYGIEEFAFANGTIWSLSDILSPAATGSDADDRIDFGGNLSYPGAPATTLPTLTAAPSMPAVTGTRSSVVPPAAMRRAIRVPSLPPSICSRVWFMPAGAACGTMPDHNRVQAPLPLTPSAVSGTATRSPPRVLMAGAPTAGRIGDEAKLPTSHCGQPMRQRVETATPVCGAAIRKRGCGLVVPLGRVRVTLNRCQVLAGLNTVPV
jgi:hypothetical protein